MENRVTKVETYNRALELLEERNVKIIDVAKIVYAMQKNYNKDLTVEDCEKSVIEVIKKREIQHALLVGIELDILTEKGLISEPLRSIIASDEGLFGIDETLAIGGCYAYGSIALTTFGHLDKEKIGIIKELDSHGEHVNTFLDDLVAMLAANASARLAHRIRDIEEDAV